MSQQPLLETVDFEILLHSATRTFLTKRHNTPMECVDDAGFTSMIWRDLPFRDSFPDFAKMLQRFLNLSTAPFPALTETPAESARMPPRSRQSNRP